MTPAFSADAPVYNRMYVFGDSYSDNGAGYIDGNGPTAVVYLAWRLGISLQPAKTNSAPDQSLNYAVSGAQTGLHAGKYLKGEFLGYGMINQVNDFAQSAKAGKRPFDPARTLFFIAGGLNDRELTTEATVAHLRQEIATLQDLGAQHFTLALLPTRIPAFSAVGLRLNPALAQFVAAERAQRHIDLRLNQWGAYFDEIMDHPSNYGFVDTVHPCAGRAIFEEDTVPVADPDTYYYYHSGHPSTAVHRIVGRMLAQEFGDRAH